jgi:hypothetical protein
MSDIKTIFQTTLTETAISDLEGVGTVRHGVNGEVYRWAKNRNATAFTAKQPVCYDAGNVGSLALLQSVNSPVTADLMLQAGIVLSALAASGDTGTGPYGWVQVEGYCPDARVLGVSGTAVAIGDELVSANGTTTLTRATAVGTAPKRLATFQALEAVSAATGATYAKDVYIRCI